MKRVLYIPQDRSDSLVMFDVDEIQETVNTNNPYEVAKYLIEDWAEKVRFANDTFYLYFDENGTHKPVYQVNERATYFYHLANPHGVIVGPAVLVAEYEPFDRPDDSWLRDLTDDEIKLFHNLLAEPYNA